MQERRTRPATAVDFHRLADAAHDRGLRLFRDGSRWYCSSASTAGGCHYVTGLSCDCPGFVAHGRCTHHALLLERLGWLPEVEEAAPRSPALERIIDTVDAEEPAPVACLWCGGSGRVPNDQLRRYDDCESCGGTGRRVDRRLAGAPAVEVIATAA
jgi:hypothetical protein